MGAPKDVHTSKHGSRLRLRLRKLLKALPFSHYRSLHACTRTPLRVVKRLALTPTPKPAFERFKLTLRFLLVRTFLWLLRRGLRVVFVFCAVLYRLWCRFCDWFGWTFSLGRTWTYAQLVCFWQQLATRIKPVWLPTLAQPENLSWVLLAEAWVWRLSLRLVLNDFRLSRVVKVSGPRYTLLERLRAPHKRLKWRQHVSEYWLLTELEPHQLRGWARFCWTLGQSLQGWCQHRVALKTKGWYRIPVQPLKHWVPNRLPREPVYIDIWYDYFGYRFQWVRFRAKVAELRFKGRWGYRLRWLAGLLGFVVTFFFVTVWNGATFLYLVCWRLNQKRRLAVLRGLRFLWKAGYVKCARVLVYCLRCYLGLQALYRRARLYLYRRLMRPKAWPSCDPRVCYWAYTDNL